MRNNMNGSNVNGSSEQTGQVLERDADKFLRRSIQDLFSLSGRTVVITGGARGIGLAFAFAVAEAGGNVAILDVANEPHLHFYELGKRHPEQRFELYSTDVTNYGVLQKSIQQIVRDFGRIDGL